MRKIVFLALICLVIPGCYVKATDKNIPSISDLLDPRKRV